MTTVDTRTVVRRGAGLTAAVSAPLLLILSFAQPEEGPSLLSATGPQIRAYVHDQAGAVRAGALVGLISTAVLLIFTAAVTRVLRDSAPGSVLADLFAGASLMLIAMMFLDLVATSVPVVLPQLAGGEDPSDDLLRGWQDIAGFTHLTGDFRMVFIAVLVAAFSIAAWTSRMVPRWVAWFGAAVAVSAAVGTAGVTLNAGPLYWFWFGGAFGWVLWLPAAGITLGVRTRRAPR
jgi:hypothetical protein